jgi:hypothetical protein
MWTEETTVEQCLDCRLPFSFYFDLIAGCWRSPTSNNLSLHRICTLARKQGANFVVLECALDQAPIREDIEAIDIVHGSGGRASAIQLSFFSGAVSPDIIADVSDQALIAAATIINYAPPNSDFTHSYIYEAIAAPPHHAAADGTRTQLLNNYICRDTVFMRSVKKREFAVSGFYYCQQNGLTHVCAHACLRMGLNSIDGAQPLISSTDINTQLGLAPPMNALMMGHVVDIITSRTGNPPNVVNCTQLQPTDYLSVLTSFIESGFIVLFVFTTVNTIEHVVTAFGYTRNSDEWHPQAIPAYSGPASAPFYRSSAWVDHIVIHDDNLGNYYALSSRAFEVDKSITAHWIIGIHPHQIQVSPHGAEAVAAVLLKNAFNDTAAYGEGRWFDYLAAQQYRFVTRPILISRSRYQEHLRASEGHDGTKLTDQEVSLTDSLPDWFWMVEFSLPSLFTGNRSKLGEVIIRSQVGTATKDFDLIEAFRLPSVLAVKDPTGNAFSACSIALQSHSPFYVGRMYTNQW